MGNVLDNIVQIEVFEGPETISTNYESEIVDVSGIENKMAIQVELSNGSASDIDVLLEVSVDGQTFFPIDDTIRNDTDPTVAVLYDVTITGVNYLRIAVTVNAGQIDLDKIQLSGGRRH